MEYEVPGGVCWRGCWGREETGTQTIGAAPLHLHQGQQGSPISSSHTLLPLLFYFKDPFPPL